MIMLHTIIESILIVDLMIMIMIIPRGPVVKTLKHDLIRIWVGYIHRHTCGSTAVVF